MAGQSVQSVWSFFGIERFKWSPKVIGISLGMVGLAGWPCAGGINTIHKSKTWKYQKYIYRFWHVCVGVSIICMRYTGMDDVCLSLFLIALEEFQDLLCSQ